MKKKYFRFCFLLLILLLTGCQQHEAEENKPTTVDATDYGLSTENDGKTNSKALQTLIDSLSEDGGTIYIPTGEYEFAENARQTIGSHCIKMRSDVSIVGDGATTVLKPIGKSSHGLDMFYFNDYLDTGEPIYLENCRFESFVIDASFTSCEVYTSAGKGFMFNLFKNCHWKNVTVKSTDATGFGVDCPIDSSITNCTAIGCGKAATLQSGGASGFGIGYGFCENEGISVSGCVAEGNKKFGFFFEHQGRFNSEMYNADSENAFIVTDCRAAGNYYGYGGICVSGIVYERCTSEYSLSCGFFFEDSANARVVGCSSKHEKNACFAVEQTEDAMFASEEILFSQCTGESSPVALYVNGERQSKPIRDVRMQSCELTSIDRAVQTNGHLSSLTLTDNVAFTSCENLLAQVDMLIDRDNSWN